MSKFEPGDQNCVIGYKRGTKSVNKLKGELKTKLETTRGTKFAIFPKNITKGKIDERQLYMTTLKGNKKNNLI